MSNYHIGRTDPDLHEEFLELCAVATSGELTGSERQRLEAHLRACRECRDAMHEFNVVVEKGVPAIADQYLDIAEASGNASWSQENELSKLLQSIPQEHKSHEWHQNEAVQCFPFMISDTWRHIFTLYATATLLFIALGIALYQAGRGTHGLRSAAVSSRTGSAQSMSLDQRLVDAKREVAAAQADLEARNRSIGDLRRNLRQQSVQLNALNQRRRQLEAELRESETDKQRLSLSQSESAKKVEIAEAQIAALEDKLHAAEMQDSDHSSRVLSLQYQVSELQQSLDAKDKALDEDQELLTYDRDIRELMGSRDLYVAEVYDVDQNGRTRKAYGRVFFTKGKSLVFYAYDLDQQKSFRHASFQAWARRDSRTEQALSLGIFYEDSASKRTWVLKTSDPKVLAHVDEVFVTVEPNGGSAKPSSRKILFASLNIEPNHR